MELALHEMHSSAQWHALRMDTLDVAITRDLQNWSEIDSQPLIQEEYVVALSTGHQLAAQSGPLELGELFDQPFVMCERSVATVLHDQILALCADAGFRPSVVQVADEWHTVLAFVRAGFGVALAPEGLRAIGWPGVVFRPLTSCPIVAELFCCWKPKTASASVREFVHFIRSSRHSVLAPP